MATLAHAAIGFGFLGIGFLLSLAINVAIWLMSRRSPHVAIHAEQAGAYQLSVFVINVLVVVAWLAASVALFGRVVFFPPAEVGEIERAAWPLAVGLWLLAVPIFGVWHVASIALGLIGALRVAAGQPFWYPFWGRWARRKHGHVE